MKAEVANLVAVDVDDLDEVLSAARYRIANVMYALTGGGSKEDAVEGLGDALLWIAAVLRLRETDTVDTAGGVQ